MWSCTTIPKSGGMGALPLSVVHSDDMLRLSATLIGNPVPLSACKLVEQFTERVDHSTSDKKHYDPEHIIHMLLKVGYSLRSFPRLPHDGLEEKNNRNCCQNYPYQLIHRDPVDNRRRRERLKEAIIGSVQQPFSFRTRSCQDVPHLATSRGQQFNI